MALKKSGALPCTKLTKAVVATHKTGKNSKQKTNGTDITAVFHNANRFGAGFRTNTRIPINDPVTVSLAFSGKDGEKGKETLPGRVRWVRNHTTKGTKEYLLGVAWDSLPTKESNPWLHNYLDITLRSY